MPFQIVPASQVAAKAKKSQSPKNRPLGSSLKQKAAQQKSTTSGKSGNSVVIAAYGARLFEPVMAREKPIHVHFHEFIIRDDDALTRFSEDGWFAVKFFLSKDEQDRSRCYLVYFLNPIIATKEHTLMQACLEAVEYKVYEFWDDDEYVSAAKRKDKEGLFLYDAIRMRLHSALGQMEQMIITILREKITAEKFLKRQQEFAKQDISWQEELARLEREELKEEAEKEQEDGGLEEGNDELESESSINENATTLEEVEETPQIFEQERQKVPTIEIQQSKIESRVESKIKSVPQPFAWGKRK